MPLAIHRLYSQIWKLWRNRRFELFLKLIGPGPSDLVLDVGGSPWFWASYPPVGQRIDILNLHELPWTSQQAPHHHLRTLIGDGRALAVADKTYDIGFSNSVLEHVGSWSDQQRFASELRRVSNALWVQTPAFECPIEPHYLTPFAQYLPKSVQKKILPVVSLRAWIDRSYRPMLASAVDTTRLLRKAEVRQLFPDCEILVERMCGVIPKSYIAVRRRT